MSNQNQDAEKKIAEKEKELAAVKDHRSSLGDTSQSKEDNPILNAGEIKQKEKPSELEMVNGKEFLIIKAEEYIKAPTSGGADKTER